MPVRIEANAEPIPGYRLIERLGGGGFGEVWKAEAPGGLCKAIKFVYGDLHSANDDEGFRAGQELKALSRVKTVHHPYIISMDRYDIVDGQLMIVMELADKTLWDRFRECRALGQPGIPREELLNYLREVAEALDLMNNQYQLQHLDIKPQNLFLVFNHVKVADFGLVKDLGTRASATITGGVTPVYAAPETFDGWLSRFSDQYSLAIVFQELLTGQRPFGGATMRQLIMQHIQGKPDTSSLPAADRPIVERALAKDPDQRYPNCLDFIQLLTAARPALEPADDGRVEGPNLPLPVDVSHPTLGVRGKAPGPIRPLDQDRGLAKVIDDRLPRVLAPRPDSKLKAAVAEALQADGAGPVSTHSTCPQGRKRADAEGAEGMIQPALVIGLGKLGLQTLVQLRTHLTEAFADPKETGRIRLLGLDTDQEAVQAVSGPDPRTSLNPSEVVLSRLHRPSHYLKARDDGKLPTDSWLSSKLLYRIPRDQNSAGLRPLGRLAFADNYRLISRRFEEELRACVPQEGDQGIRSGTLRVYIATSLGGNTGSGMFLDVAYAVRHLLKQLGQRAEIVGLFFLPPPGKPEQPTTALANACAALTELSHFTTNCFTARYDTGDKAHARTLADSAAPFERCVVLELPEMSRSTADDTPPAATALAGEFLYRELATPLGRAAEDSRRRGQSRSSDDGGLLLQTFGMVRLTWPRSPLLAQCGRRLARRLVDRWMRKDSGPIVDQVRQWTAERWDASGMRPENLVARYLEILEKNLKQAPDRLLAAVVAPVQAMLAPKTAPNEPAPSLGPVVQALAQFDKLLGVPEECRAQGQAAYEPSTLEIALAEACAGAGDECEQRLAELAVRLIEDPRARLAGAEECLRQFSILVEQALQAQETLAKELHERAVQLYQRLQQLLERPVTQRTPQGNWKLGFGKRSPNGETPGQSDLLELLKLYPKTRFHALLLQNINRLYLGLRGHLSDQLREVGFCRQRLGELAGLVAPIVDEAARKPLPTNGRVHVLLPAECRNLQDVVTKVDQALADDDVVDFDTHAQELVSGQFGALVQVCMGPSSMVRGFAPALIRKAEEYLAPRFQGASVADMFLNQAQSDGSTSDTASKSLAGYFEQAKPTGPLGSKAEDFAIAFVPNDLRGQEVQEILGETLPDLRVIGSDRSDEIAIYRERANLTLADLEQQGPLAMAAYRQRLDADPSAVHCREDVFEWQSVALAQR